MDQPIHGAPSPSTGRRLTTGPERRAAVIQWAEAHDLTLMLADGFDDAIMGVVHQSDGHAAILYHGPKVTAILRAQHPDWTANDFNAWFDANMGAELGPGFPAYLVMHVAAFVEAPCSMH